MAVGERERGRTGAPERMRESGNVHSCPCASAWKCGLVLLLIKALSASAPLDAGGPDKQRGESDNIKTVMGKLKPFLLTFIGVVISLAIINRIAAIRNFVNGN